MTNLLEQINILQDNEDMQRFTVFFYKPRWDYKGWLSWLGQRLLGLTDVYSHVSVAYGFTCVDFTTDGIVCTTDARSYYENYREAADVLTFNISDEQFEQAIDFIEFAAEEEYYVDFTQFLKPSYLYLRKKHIREYMLSCTAPVYVTLDWLEPDPLCYCPTILREQLTRYSGLC